MVSNAAYIAAINGHVMPLLQSFFAYQQVGNASAHNGCFLVEEISEALNLTINPTPVTIDPALPALSFTSPVYAFHAYYAPVSDSSPSYESLPTDDPTEIIPCGNTMSCFGVRSTSCPRLTGIRAFSVRWLESVQHRFSSCRKLSFRLTPLSPDRVLVCNGFSSIYLFIIVNFLHVFYRKNGPLRFRLSSDSY